MCWCPERKSCPDSTRVLWWQQEWKPSLPCCEYIKQAHGPFAEMHNASPAVCVVVWKIWVFLSLAVNHCTNGVNFLKDFHCLMPFGFTAPWQDKWTCSLKRQEVSPARLGEPNRGVSVLWTRTFPTMSWWPAVSRIGRFLILGRN